MDFRFHNKSKFALLAVNNAYTDLPDEPFQLSDGTWVLPGVPVTDLRIWEKWLGSLRVERLGRAKLVLFVEEPSDNLWILDDVHQRLSKNLGFLFWMLHLRLGIEIFDSADLLCGSSLNGVPEIRRVEQLPRFYRSRGEPRSPINSDWLEGSLVLRAGFADAEADKTQFRRIIRGLNTLFKGLKEETGQDRLHQFVRSLEALIFPEKGKTRKQLAQRCQTFARKGKDTRNLLLEAFDLRSATEHLNPWDKAVQCYPLHKREAVCWQRTRQIEHLACEAYSRLLRDPALRKHFRTNNTIEAFWKLPAGERIKLWGTPLDIAKEPFVQDYGQ